MQKLPVVATYANVMRFAFGRFFTTLRLSWLPIILLLGVIAAHFSLQFAMIAGRIQGGVPDYDPSTGVPPFGLNFGLMFGMQGLLFVLQLIAMTAVAVSIHRVILFGDTKPGVWFNFPFGATEMRFLAMGLLFALMVVAVIVSIVAPVLFLVTGGNVVTFFQDWGESQAKFAEFARGGGLAALIVAYLAGWITVLFLMVRLAVWPPSVVATGSLSPAEPWRLTRGNFWNLIGLFILTGATIYAIMIPFGIAFAGYLFANLGDLPAKGKEIPPEVVFETMKSVLPVVAVFYFFLIVFVTGTTVAVLSYAYKALKGIDAKEPVPA
jgi:hypothetical protein